MGKKRWSDWVWDGWCILSIIGIWPRYIEPERLTVNRLKISIPALPKQLDGLKILQFSDLHWSTSFSPSLRKKMIRSINALAPDLIVFTGDFVCCSKLEKAEELEKTLNALRARFGSFAVLGNHDYARFVTVSASGDYDVEAPTTSSTLGKGFNRLLHPVELTGHVTDAARQVDYHEELIGLLKRTPFQLLVNETVQVAINGSLINICGLEEYSLGKCEPVKAFRNYNKSLPGIILSHNPDALQILKNCPGDLILSGHTHGGQVNLPGLWRKFTGLENMDYKQGFKKVGDKQAYINRGIGSVMKFRWFAPPELTLFSLQRGN